MIWTFIKIAATVAFLILLIVFILAIVSPKSPDWERALSASVDDPTEDDEADWADKPTQEIRRLTRRAEQIAVPREGVAYRPHTSCVDNWADGEYHRVHAQCRAAIVSAKART